RSLRDAGALGRMSDRFFVATRKGVFTIERRKGRPRARWAITRAHFLADNASIVLPDRREGAVYVALGHGHFGVKLHRSRDGGRKWEPCATPVYPPKPEGIDDREPNSGKPIPGSTELVWALEAGHDTEPGTLWCGTLPGGLFPCRDRGGSWQLGEAVWGHPKRGEGCGGGAGLPALHSMCVVAGARGHRAGGGDEQRIPVTGRVVAARTRNGGKSFQVLAKGLPQQHAYDLPYRHALDVDATGGRLAFGTTTGSLSVSENQGDSWETVSEYLPPVYCVRFG